jgi:uncharacterized membrane protein
VNSSEYGAFIDGMLVGIIVVAPLLGFVFAALLVRAFPERRR